MTPLDSSDNQPAQYHHQYREVNLLDFVKFIKSNLLSLMSVFLICLVPFVIYIVFDTKQYRAEAFFSMPREAEIRELNTYALTGHSPAFEIHTPGSVFYSFISRMDSIDVQWDYFLSSGFYSRYKKIERWNNERRAFKNWFHREINVEPVDTAIADGVLYKVSFDSTDKDIVEEVINGFYEYAMQRTVVAVIAGIRSEVEARTQKLKREIDSAIESAELRRQDSVKVLTEALDIANRLNLDTTERTILSGKNWSGGVSVNTVEVPLYMRGRQALEAEIDGLKSRESNDAFIEGLRELQEQLSVLSKTNIDNSKIKIATVEQRAELLENPVSVSALMILLSGIVLSTAASLFTVWLYTYLRKANNIT